MRTLFVLAGAAGALAAGGAPALASSCGCYVHHHVHHRVHMYRAPPAPVVYTPPPPHPQVVYRAYPVYRPYTV